MQVPLRLVLGRRRAVRIEAPEVVLLPVVDAIAVQVVLPPVRGQRLGATAGELPMLLGKLRLGRQVAVFRPKRFELDAPLRHEHAERLAGAEGHDDVRTGELPVHRERLRGPIRLDDAFERTDRVLGRIGRPAHQQVVAGRRAEEKRDLPGQDPVAEVALGRRVRGVARPARIDELDAIRLVPAGPADEERAGIEDKPTGLIRDHHRQTAIGPAKVAGVHPRPVRRGRDDRQLRRAGDPVGAQKKPRIPYRVGAFREWSIVRPTRTNP